MVRPEISPLVRCLAGLIGFLGVAATGFEAVQEGEIQADFLLFAKLFALFVFVYVAMFGKNPLDFGSAGDEND